MSLHLEMLQVARLAPQLLGDSTPLVGQFLQRQQNADGGFRDRAGSSDLYYTAFALDSLTALTPVAPPSSGRPNNLESASCDPEATARLSPAPGGRGSTRAQHFLTPEPAAESGQERTPLAPTRGCRAAVEHGPPGSEDKVTCKGLPRFIEKRSFSANASPFGDSVTAAAAYLQRFGKGDGLDLIHLSCLVRAEATLALWGGGSPGAPADLARRLETFRCADGGYHVQASAAYGTAYAAFLALGAYEDLRQAIPDADRLAQCLAALATPDGAWANERFVSAGATNPTAAAVGVLRGLGQRPALRVADWLRAQFCPQGGFRAGPGTPLPDLLSTATALHTLASLGADFGDLREPCMDFVDSLWTNEGSFHAHWLEPQLDAEYTFYGLLALGHLASVQN